MSTHALITIRDAEDEFLIYVHCDGYPNGKGGLVADLKRAPAIAWPAPRFEAGDMTAAIVATLAPRKKYGGNVYLTKYQESGQAYDYLIYQDPRGVVTLEITEPQMGYSNPLKPTRLPPRLHYRGKIADCTLDHHKVLA